MANQQKSLLLELPPELRNTIYEYVFEGGTTSILSSYSESPWISHTNPSMAVYSPTATYCLSHKPAQEDAIWGLPPLLATNHQIRDEAIGIFYARTGWVAPTPFMLKSLLQRIGPERTQLSRCITLSVPHPDRKVPKPLANDAGKYIGEMMWEALKFVPNNLFLRKKRLMIEVSGKDEEILWEGSREVGGRGFDEQEADSEKGA